MLLRLGRWLLAIGFVVLCVLAWRSQVQITRRDLFEAVRNGNVVKVGNILRRHPGMVNTAGRSNMTPLHWAVRISQLDMVVLLLTRDADVNARNNRGMTPLHLVAYLPDPSTAVVLAKSLLAFKADVNARDDKGYTPLLSACATSNESIVELLLSRHADPRIANEKKNTPLHMAAALGRPKLVQLLLSHGADPTAKDAEGQTPLDLAVRNHHGDVAAMLTPKGAP